MKQNGTRGGIGCWYIRAMVWIGILAFLAISLHGDVTATPDVASFANVFEDIIAPQHLKRSDARCALGRPAFVPELPMRHCPMYRKLSCCRESTAKKLFLQPETNLPGNSICPGCVHNIRSLQCAMLCSPWQHHFFQVKGARKQLRLCNSFCTSFMRSCGEIQTMLNSTVNDLYINGATKESADERRAAAMFCTDYFGRSKTGFEVEVVEDSESCFGHTHIEPIAVCDPFARDRLVHIMNRLQVHKQVHFAGFVIVLLLFVALIGCGPDFCTRICSRRKEQTRTLRKFDRGIISYRDKMKHMP